MRETKYYLRDVRNTGTDELEGIYCNIPMNVPIMLVRVEGQLRLKRLDVSPTAQKPITKVPVPEQVSLL